MKILKVCFMNFSNDEIFFALKVLGDEKAWGDSHLFLIESNVKNADIIACLMPQIHINKLFKKYEHLQNLSVTDSTSSPIKIYFSEDNWQTIPQQSGYKNIHLYRTYLILHEFGHSIGHGHEKCPGVGHLAPVMMQQTKGTEKCLPDPWVKKI